ncbi:MAG: hypothetical protein L3J06_00070 [Cyclobacteriaceae bacterium]|nr:hypothetical protein [Cyclobacteriaceae bacterium]
MELAEGIFQLTRNFPNNRH